jgi:hypothetical protein
MKGLAYFRFGVRARCNSLLHSLLHLVLLVMLHLMLEVLRQIVDSGVRFVVSLIFDLLLGFVDLRELN